MGLPSGHALQVMESWKVAVQGWILCEISKSGAAEIEIGFIEVTTVQNIYRGNYSSPAEKEAEDCSWKCSDLNINVVQKEGCA